MKQFFLIAFFTANVLGACAQWTTAGVNDIANTNSGSVGIGTTTPQAKLVVAPGTLGSAADTKLRALMFETGVGYNTSMLEVATRRFAAGNDWLSTSTRIQQIIDGTPMAFIDFNPQYNSWGMSLGAAGEGRLFVNSSGNVGIGVSTAAAQLQVNGGQIISTQGTASNSRTLTLLQAGTSQVNFDQYAGMWRSTIQMQNSDATKGLFFAPPEVNYNYSILRSINGGVKIDVGGSYSSPGSNAFTIESNGQIGIGVTTMPATHKLAVGGSIIAEKIKVSLQPWADYVFEPSYKLPTLPEVEAFIKANKHLPDVPSASEVEKNGLDLGDNQATLLKKIEELTLYVIEQDKQQLKQAQALETQAQLIKMQHAEMQLLKEQINILIKKSK